MIRIDPFRIIHRYAINRVQTNKNWLSTLSGETGSGKSTGAMRIGSWIDPNFSIDDVVFTTDQYLERFEELDKARRKGAIIVYDEAILFNSRESGTTENKAMVKVLNLLRFSNISSIFCIPDTRGVDVGLIRLLHNHMTTIDVDRKTCPNWQKHRTGIKFREVIRQTGLSGGGERDIPTKIPRMEVKVRNTFTGELYMKTIKVDELWLKAPDKELLNDYDRKKRRNFDRALAEARTAIQAKKAKESNKATKEINKAVSSGELPMSALPTYRSVPQPNPNLFNND